jgi:hypothetical protein
MERIQCQIWRQQEASEKNLKSESSIEAAERVFRAKLASRRRMARLPFDQKLAIVEQLRALVEFVKPERDRLLRLSRSAKAKSKLPRC